MNIEIANRLQTLRKENGYSQEQLALELGISRQAVSKWERAESSPDTDNLICLAKLYNVSLDCLLSTTETIEEIKEGNDIEEDEKHINNKILRAINASIPLVIILIYFILGAVFNLWHPSWIIFLFIPILFSLIEAINVRKWSVFLYPVLVTAIYLFLGFWIKWWHPGWILFLTIPLYYVITEQLDKR